MNILFICDIVGPIGLHNRKWIQNIQTDRDNIFVATPSKLEDYESFINNKGFKILKHLNPFSFSSPIETIKQIIELNLLIYKYNIQIIHILYAAPNAIWALFLNKKIIITTRGSDILITIPELNKGGFKNKLFYFLYRRALEKANYITSTSSEQVNKIKSILKTNIENKVYLIRTGVKIERINLINSERHLPEQLKNKKIIFFPRYMEPLYNHELELEAIKKLPLKILSTYCFIFIKNDEKRFDSYRNNFIKQLEFIKELDFIFLFNLSQNEMFSIYKKASLTIMVPLSDGTPNSALEALAAECPLILGSYNYDMDVFDNVCFKLTTNSAFELAEKIIISLTDYPKDFITNGFKKVNEAANIDSELAKVKKLYSNCQNQ